MEGYLSAKESVEKYIEGSRTKFQSSFLQLFSKAIMAGAMIAFGAAASSVAAHTVSDVGLARLAAAVVFPVGLMMVILLGAELFTGDCMIAMSVMDGKQKLGDLIRVLFVVYLGNFVGATLLAGGIVLSGQLDYTAGMLGAYTIKVAIGKTNISFEQGIVSGILCNILVCAAVLMAGCAKDITGKLMASFFTIMLFVTAGFEHCVANMYYITAGLLAKSNSEYVRLAMETYGYSQNTLDGLNVTNFLVTNLVPVTIGNILGGVLFLAVPMYCLNIQKEKKNRVEVKEKRDVICTTVFADSAH
ncbi:MAG: formate/nitrite transporter family protein [Agathobacter sp.]|nr:formate/nitrite transporter family protein [Lachnospiraceae bacterium]MBQ8626046.1 formate/nitrite transporter family protein [Agathobacter sp.]